MSKEDIIAAWKGGPSGVGSARDLPDNPAGRMQIDPAVLQGAQGGTTLPCWTAATVALSCWPPCQATVWDGTCNIASIGCCVAE